MTKFILCVGAGLGGLLFAAAASPVAAMPTAGLTDMSARPALVREVGYKRRYYRDRGSYVRAPFTEVDTRRGTWVAAPFVRVYSDRHGTWVRAPFVNHWSPR